VKGPIPPILKRLETINEHKCKIFHNGQFQPHCKVCLNKGHSTGDDECEKRNVGPPIKSFRSYQNILSNFAPCELQIFDQCFSSAEHANQWAKAIHLDKKDLAKKIKQAPHAGIAKQLSKSISVEESSNWEKLNVQVMKDILDAKFAQVEEFATTLLDTKGYFLTEGTTDDFWASGLSPEISEMTSPMCYPGLNKLGYLLMEIRDCAEDNKESHENSVSDEHRETDKESVQ
jgi:ribA/ribD-fused uncharacterized protein